MCKIGDIIVVNKYIGEDGKTIGRHSFIVIDDNLDTIQGLEYTHVTTVISSFKNEEQRKNKLKYKCNIEVTEFEKNGDLKEFKNKSYIKADKIFYFNKEKLDYYVFGRISDELLDKLIKIIILLDKENKISIITSNL